MRLTWSRGSSRAYRATRREFTVSPRGGRIYLALRCREASPRRPLSCRPLPLAGGPVSRQQSFFGKRIRCHDKDLQNLWLAASRDRDFLETEATAGIEPAMKVLQTSALPLGYVAQEARTDAFGAARVVQVYRRNSARAGDVHTAAACFPSAIRTSRAGSPSSTSRSSRSSACSPPISCTSRRIACASSSASASSPRCPPC